MPLNVKVGDEVTLFGFGLYPDEPYSIRMVMEVLKNRIVLSDGTRWDLNGKCVGYKGYHILHIEPTTCAHREAIRREHLLSSIRLFKDWQKVPTGALQDLKRIIDMVKAAEAEDAP